MDILSTFYPNLNTTNNLVPRVFVHVYSQNRETLDPMALKCVFVGYSSTHKRYKCYHPPSKKFYVSVDTTFNEQESYFINPYLQGQNSPSGRQGRFLLDLSPTPPCSSCSNPVPENPSDFVPESMPRPEPMPETPNESMPKHQMSHKRNSSLLLEM